jgi:crotonobetainyl-CoA:carnitine CoA-transferase CaiB-like acyl-CoA transferase
MVLQDVTVLDLTQQLPGPLCTQVLADFGAKVIKVESPGGDTIRTIGWKMKGESGPFLTLNRNKKSIVLNLKREKGKEIFHRLSEKADIIIEGFRPGVVSRLGIGYEGISRINERIVYCSLSGYGQNGPYRDRPGHDINYVGLGGILGLTGTKGSRPVIIGGQVADITGAFLSVIGILLALRAREKTGKGQYIDIAMLDGVVSWLPGYLGEYMATGTIPDRSTMMLNGGCAFYNVYETKDGRFLSLGAIEPHFWRNVCKEIGHERLIPDQFGPPHKQKEMILKLRKTFKQKTLEEWTELFAGKDVPCEPVLTFDALLSNPQVLFREMITEIDHPKEGKIKQVGIPIKLSATPGKIGTPAPSLGQHTYEILTEAGMTREEITALVDEKIVT